MRTKLCLPAIILALTVHTSAETPSAETKWRKLPDAPALKALADVSKRGFWWARWRVWSASKIPQVFATGDGLYSICLGRLIHYPASGGGPREISDKTWRAVAQERKVWALTTGGMLRYDAATGKTDRFASGGGCLPGGPWPWRSGTPRFSWRLRPTTILASFLLKVLPSIEPGPILGLDGKENTVLG